MVTITKRKIFALLLPVLLFLSTATFAKQGNEPQKQLSPALRNFLNYEQNYMSLSVDPFRLDMGRGNLQDKFYAPESGNIFELKSYWIKAQDLHVFQSETMEKNIQKIMVIEKDGEKLVRFFVHPESESFYAELLKTAEPAESFHATATSSSRSLLVWREDVAPFIAKVSLNQEVAALIRTIPKSEISRSIGTNNTLLASKASLPKNFDWMQETMGIVPKGADRGGMIIRELPAGLAEGKRVMIPLFALYGGNEAQGPPLLAKMIKQSGEVPSEFIRNRIIDPFVKMWLSTSIDSGFTMEAHAQNTLIELDEKGLPNGKYVFRDLGGFDIDFPYRDQLHSPKAKSLPYIDHFKKEYHQNELKKAVRSSLYGHFAGGFVYNLDKYVPQWMQKNMIPKEDLKWDFFSSQLLDSFKRNYELHTGIPIKNMKGLFECQTYVAKARKVKITPSAWRCLRALFSGNR